MLTVSSSISRHLCQPPFLQLSLSLSLSHINQVGLSWQFPAHLSVPTGASCVWDSRLLPLLTHPHCSCGLVNAELAPADQIQGRVNSKVLVAQMHVCGRSGLSLTCKKIETDFPIHNRFPFPFFPSHDLLSLVRSIHSRLAVSSSCRWRGVPNKVANVHSGACICHSLRVTVWAAAGHLTNEEKLNVCSRPLRGSAICSLNTGWVWGGGGTETESSGGGL